MGDSIRCVSDHAEDLADGRTIAVGGFAEDVDLTDQHNERLLKERRIIRLDPEQTPDPGSGKGKGKTTTSAAAGNGEGGKEGDA